MIHDITIPRNGNWPRHAPIKREPTRNIKEVAEMFGYKSTNSLHGAISRGHFPAPDVVVEATNRAGRRLYWRLNTLEKEKQRREKS